MDFTDLTGINEIWNEDIKINKKYNQLYDDTFIFENKNKSETKFNN